MVTNIGGGEGFKELTPTLNYSKFRWNRATQLQSYCRSYALLRSALLVTKLKGKMFSHLWLKD